eukprot:XP_011668062.1 PREDICTED: tyrosyl-DNA phosphodiesterase 1 [Strongylocentrotus purpuratus]
MHVALRSGKMMFLLYADGMRVVIHTANIIESDWHQKTQGVWISPLFPKLPSSNQTATNGESPSFFKRDLLAYLTAYRSPSLQPWKDHITQHDFSSAKVFLISSVPGRHARELKNKWGHLKVRKILRQYGPDKEQVQTWPVIGQFSSIGSLGGDKTKWLCAEFLQSMSTVKGQSGSFTSNADTRHMKLIFPCSDNVRTSLEGYPAGASLPYSIQTAKKQPYLHQFFFFNFIFKMNILLQILRQYGPDKEQVQTWPVIGQFSSIGSLGGDKTKWLCAEFLQSMSTVKGQSGSFTSNADTRHMKLIFPCSDNVRTSLEGYPAGASLPYSIQTAKKQPYLHQFFFANLSKAAWGAYEKNASQLMIRSYEIGVMMIPSFFDKSRKTFPLTEGRGQKEFSLPWDVPLTPYSKTDRPWIWDIPYTDKPDSHGNAWVPGRR